MSRYLDHMVQVLTNNLRRESDDCAFQTVELAKRLPVPTPAYVREKVTHPWMRDPCF
jgi:hypothetical protein